MICKLCRIIAVSYTHLDVYKRQMYSYTNKRKLSKKKVFLSLTCLFVAGVAYFTYDYMNKQSQAAPVFKEESLPVLALPDSVKKIGLPFQVEATTALDFFDGKQGDIESMTLFEGVYRGNQGMDYTFGEEAFEVVSCYDGKVSEVKDDPIFGQSVSIASVSYTHLTSQLLTKALIIFFFKTDKYRIFMNQ